MKDETIEELEEFYGSGTSLSLEEEFKKRYEGKNPNDIAKQVVNDIHKFDCGYGLQARVWRDIKDKNLSLDSLLTLFFGGRTHTIPTIIKDEIANKLIRVAKEQLKDIPTYPLSIIAQDSQCDQATCAAFWEEYLGRKDLENCLEENITAKDEEIDKRLTVKYIEREVRWSKSKESSLLPISIGDDSRKIIERVLRHYQIFDKSKSEEFAKEALSSIEKLAYKYL